MCTALGLTSAAFRLAFLGSALPRPQRPLFLAHLSVSFAEGDIYQLAGECVVLLARILANNLRPSDWGG